MESPSFLLSVVTVCRNSEATLGRTLQSLRDQSDKRFESIVIDGGSEDGTGEIMERFADTIEHAVSEKDKGIYFAMNKGLALARGTHVAFLNSDDAYMPHTVACTAHAAQAHPTAVLCGNMRKERELSGRLLTRDERPHPDLMPETMGVFHPASFVPTSLFDRFGSYDTRFALAADYHWFLKAYLAGIPFHHIDEVLALFRVGGVSNLSCATYREAARIQRELNTGHPEDMEKLYRRCKAKMKQQRLIGKMAKWPILKNIYEKKVAKRWR